MKLSLGLNPYGLAFTVGLQHAGTPRANPAPVGLDGFMARARRIGARCLEIHGPWLEQLDQPDLARLTDECRTVRMQPIVSTALTHRSGETLETAISLATTLGARVIRLGLTPVLEGARATWGPRWGQFVDHANAILGREAQRAADADITIGIEDHQDFGSEELVAMAEAAGPNVGIVFDTGNPFAVGEDPVAFARRAAERVCHLHLKDYRAQFTAEGYRLVRCAIGDGAVPFDEILAALGERHAILTGSIESGALEARHIKLFTKEWWTGYPPRPAAELGAAIGRLRRQPLPENGPFETPWERGASPAEIVEFERVELERSVANMRRFAVP